MLADIFIYFRCKTKVKQQRCILELDSFPNDVTYWLSGITFLMLEYFLNFLCYSQCNGYRNKVLYLIYIMTFPITFCVNDQ